MYDKKTRSILLMIHMKYASKLDRNKLKKLQKYSIEEWVCPTRRYLHTGLETLTNYTYNIEHQAFLLRIPQNIKLLNRKIAYS